MTLSTGNHLFAQECTFVMSGAAVDALPPTTLAEIAFAGRSNVGKSSLVNALTGRLTLAKTSNTPGRTQLLNFFNLAGALMLVDLPGYGYARAPKADVKRWTRLVNDYLTGRPNLRRVLLLIDSRHGLKEVDEGIMALLDEAAVNYQLILTKTDKIKTSELKQVQAEALLALKKHPAAHPHVLATSSEKKDGIGALRDELAALA